MKNIKFREVLAEIQPKQKAEIVFLAVLRVLANGLDLLGLAGIALLASAFGSIAAGTAREAPLSLPLIGDVFIAETEAVLIALGIAMTFVLKSVFSVWLTLRTSLKIAQLESGFAERLTRSYFQSAATSEQVTEDKDVAKFQNSVLGGTSALSGFLNAVIGLIAEGSLAISLLAIFFLVNPWATLGTMVYFAGVLLALNSQITRRLKRNAIASFEGNQEMLQSSRDLFGVQREVAVAGSSNFWLERIISGKRLSAQAAAVNTAISTLPRYVLETSLILGIFGFLALVVLLSDLASQSVTIGIFMAGGLRLVASILPIQNAYNAMSSSSAAGGLTLRSLQREKVENQLLDATGEKLVCGTQLDSGTLEFKDVSFSYHGATLPTIDGVSFTVEPLSKTAIVGPSGAGKTTLFELSTGRLLPSAGEVRVLNQSPTKLVTELPGLIGVVPQRPNLVKGSLAQNVSLAAPEETDSVLVETSLKRAGLEEFLHRDPLGVELQISPDSGQMSGGEIQRLGLARALYRNPKLLFLDEATSALDAETEAKISKVLDELKDEMTVVLIAHRLSTVMNSDNIIYLNKGKVVAQGTFAELKKSVPDFAKAVELMDLGE